MSYILWPVLFCGFMCSVMSISYSLSDDRRAQRLAKRWLIHMFVYAGIGLLVVYLEKIR